MHLWKKVKVWINGTFDVIHTGHIKLFDYGKKLSGRDGYLKVGTDSDLRIKLLKGEQRPINNLEDRLEVLRSIRFIDEVVSFSTDDELEEHIRNFSPDILVIGSDYIGKNIIGQKWVGKVEFFERYGGLSTTGIISKIR